MPIIWLAFLFLLWVAFCLGMFVIVVLERVMLALQDHKSWCRITTTPFTGSRKVAA